MLILSTGISVRKFDTGLNGTYRLYKILCLFDSEVAKQLELPKLHFIDQKRVWTTHPFSVTKPQILSLSFFRPSYLEMWNT